MGLSDELKKYADSIFMSKWETREGNTVPETETLKLKNEGVYLDAVVLYADLTESTIMVSNKTACFSAEVYKAFLYCASKIIENKGGTITAFDGDRVMGVFIGSRKNTDAVIAALQINWAVKNIVIPSMINVYKNLDFTLQHSVGVDGGKLLVAKTGVRGSNDLVWVGPAANYAAKLSELKVKTDGYCTWISQGVFNVILDEAKYDNYKNLMWTAKNWIPYNKSIYGSNYWWSF